jgi:hypothetical protein
MIDEREAMISVAFCELLLFFNAHFKTSQHYALIHCLMQVQALNRVGRGNTEQGQI